MAEISHKIASIVTAQIFLIIASFLIMAHFESLSYHTGNTVNVAGKNRVLATQVHAELVGEILESGRLQDGSRALSTLDDLRGNILFLKLGGAASGIESAPLPAKFHGEWSVVWEKFEEYEDMVYGFVSDGLAGSDEDGLPVFPGPAEDIAGIKRTGDELVALSDALTDKLGQDVDARSSNLILLQAMLGVTNVAVHIFMIMLVWRVFSRHAEQRAGMEKFAAMGEFAATMAHNMKNPLGTVLNSVTLMRRRGNDPRTVDLASKEIERSVRQMTHQIDGVMNYVRDVPLVQSTGSLHEMLGRSLGMISVPDRIVTSLPDRDMLLTCDPEKMEIVFANLLLNAVHAIGTDNGRITVRLAEDKTDAGFATLEFENTGPAIPERDMPEIFKPLFTTKMRGTGLGLASCQNIVNRHGGSITASSDPVTFTLRLPLDVPQIKTDKGGSPRA